jgi:hypothetical protein
MTKFLAFDVEAADPDSENAGDIKFTAVLFIMQQEEGYKGFRPKKLDELLLFIKPKKEFNLMDIMYLFEYDGSDKFLDFYNDSDIILVDKDITSAFSVCALSHLIIDVRKMAKCLIKDFEMEQGENGCETIMNTISLFWEKQEFMYFLYPPEFKINKLHSKR